LVIILSWRLELESRGQEDESESKVELCQHGKRKKCHMEKLQE
jgi:hypothetical protein